VSVLGRTVDGVLRAYWPIRRFRWRLRWWLLRLRVELHARAVGSRVAFEIAPRVQLGRRISVEVLPRTHSRIVMRGGTWLADDVVLQLSGGTLDVGPGTLVRSGFRATVGGDLVIGARVVISWGTSLHCAESLRIGDDTLVGERCVLTDSRHPRTTLDVAILHESRAKATAVGANAWLGAGTVIGSGVDVGDCAFIGANSVVTKDVPAWWFAAGAPAKPLRKLEIE